MRGIFERCGRKFFSVLDAGVNVIKKTTVYSILRFILGQRGVVLLVFLYAFAIVAPPVKFLTETVLATHGGTHMLILWDGTNSASSPISVPTGWSVLSTYDGRFPRGESPANVLQTGGGGAHAPTVASLTHDNPAADRSIQGGGSPAISAAPHSHTFSAALGVGAASNNDEPAFRSLMLLRYDAGIPTEIPSGGIVFFDNDPGIPDTGWTQQSAQNDRFVKLNNSVGTGGNDSHTHTLTWPSLLASGDNQNANANSANTSAPPNHTHAAPSPTATGSVSVLPPHVKPLVAKADALTLIPVGMLAMFDGSPGPNWAVRSGVGGTYHQQFLRPAATYNGTSAGSATHTHGDESAVSGSSGVSNGSNTAILPAARTPHSHAIYAQFNAVENLPEYVNVVIAQRVGAQMLLFWDGTGGPPTGWSYFNDANGRYLRGETAGNFGTTGGNATHTPTTSSVTANPLTTSANLTNGGQAAASLGHTHTASVTNITSANNLPAYCNVRLISYDAGVPNIIPQNAIAVFDDSPGVPGDWTDLTNRYNRLIRAHTSVGNNCAGADAGGSDTHNHTITWSSLGAAVGTQNKLNAILGGNAPAAVGHTHPAPGNSNANTITSLPAYVRMYIARAGSDTPTISLGLTAVFNGDPGGGWVIRSNPGGPLYQKFIRPAGTYDDSAQGDADGIVQHANLTSGPSGNSSADVTDAQTLLGNVAPHPHTHTVTAAFNTENITPEYYNVVVAEKVNFILNAYYWYEHVDNENVTSRWGNPDLDESGPIRLLPASNGPPGEGTALRLRIQILVNGNDLNPNAVELKLQYRQALNETCETGDNWVDVGASGSGAIWRYGTSTVGDGATLTQTKFSTPSTIFQTYIKSATSGTNPNAADIGDYIEYDFHIEQNGADQTTQYSFRVLETNGTLLSQYTECPTLVTRAGTDQQMRHGNVFLPSLSDDAITPTLEQGFTWAD